MSSRECYTRLSINFNPRAKFTVSGLGIKLHQPMRRDTYGIEIRRIVVVMANKQYHRFSYLGNYDIEQRVWFSYDATSFYWILTNQYLWHYYVE